MPESALLKSFLSLVLLVAVLGIILLFIKRLAKKTRLKKQNSELSILTRMSLSPKAHLYIVQAENKKLLLGVTDHHVSLVHDYSKPNQLPDLINKDDSTAIPKEMLKQKPIKSDDESLSFGNFLKTAFKKQ